MSDGSPQCRLIKNITNQTPEIEEREWFKKYTLVNLVQVAYTREFIEQKECIHMHALSQKGKLVWDGKLRRMKTRGSYHGIDPW